MVFSLPEFETTSQDFTNTLDIDSLVRKYILPIQKIRSSAKVVSGKQGASLLSEFDSLSLEKEPQESLTHAFYRLLGLPVVAPDGTFYSPGFEPGGIRKLKRKQEIANKLFGSKLEEILFRREFLSQEKKGFFSFQDLRSTLLAIALKIPRSFNILSPSIGPLEKDDQIFVLPERKKEIDVFTKRNPQIETGINEALKRFSSSSFSSDLTHGQQINKPFSLHPRIENSVLPDDRQICVPFLSLISSTVLSSFTQLLRPGIELILQERIFPSDKNFWLSNIEKILTNNKSPSTSETAEIQTLKSSISSLFSSSEIDNQTVLQIIDDQNPQNIIIFDSLIKTLRFLVSKLVQNLQVLDRVEQEINWYPVLSPNGPEDGINGAFLLFGSVQNFPLEQKILELRIKKLDQEKGNNISFTQGNFASPFEIQSSDQNSNQYVQSLNEALEYRKLIGNKGLLALQEIEYLTGEISGLGLIDILILYATLWTIPLSSLFGLLDLEAYERMKNSLSSLSSIIENAGRDDISTAMQNLEKNVFNLQNFVDRLLSEEKLSLHKL